MLDVTTSLNRHYVVFDGVYLLGQKNNLTPISVFGDRINAELFCVRLLKKQFLSLGYPKNTFSLIIDSFSRSCPECEVIRYGVSPVKDDSLPSRVYSIVMFKHLSRRLKRLICESSDITRCRAVCDNFGNIISIELVSL